MPTLPGDGSTVVFPAPDLPAMVMGPSVPDTVTLVPVAGPKGDKGDPGSLDDLTTVQDMIDTSVNTHIVAPLPHPAYDDIVDLRLVFENGLI